MKEQIPISNIKPKEFVRVCKFLLLIAKYMGKEVYNIVERVVNKGGMILSMRDLASDEWELEMQIKEEERQMRECGMIKNVFQGNTKEVTINNNN